MNETDIREMGLDWENVQKCFIWSQLSRDFIRELVEYDPVYKTQLQHHLLCAFHGYASYPSYFYNNMWVYLQLGLAEQKELKYYADKLYMMYREQAEKEFNSRVVHKFVDGTGKVLDQWVF